MMDTTYFLKLLKCFANCILDFLCDCITEIVSSFCTLFAHVVLMIILSVFCLNRYAYTVKLWLKKAGSGISARSQIQAGGNHVLLAMEMHRSYSLKIASECQPDVIYT